MADAPEPLLVARRTLLEEVGGVRLVRDWHAVDGKWVLRVELTPGGLAAVHQIPDSTPWYVLVDRAYPSGLIDIVPDAEGGLTETFPHQIPNTATPGRPYRGGKICVATDSENNLRSDRDAEPRTAADRLAWHVVRALEWLRRASAGTLLVDGDWFELPFFRGETGGLLAFREGPDDFAIWESIPNTVGLADVVELRHRGLLAVTAFRTMGKAILYRPRWGDAISGKEMPRAMWVRLPTVVSRPPYRAPRDFGELRATAQEQGVDLDAALRAGTADFHDRADHLLLVGFPVPERVGEAPRQMHWQAIDLPRLERKVINGFRPNATGWWVTSRRGTLADESPLDWRTSENWHPDQLATRGRLQASINERPTLLIGAGALGSVVGELLVRAGVRDLIVADPDRFVAGNLVRHTLTLEDLGQYKAEALAARLRVASPNVKVQAVAAAVAGPPDDASLLDVGLVVDTTGNHGVLETLADLAWTATPTFASFAISLHARHLFAFVSKGPRLDIDAFDTAYQPFAIAERERDEERPWEGVGCFHPVFPARADQVALMASTAVGLLEDVSPVAEGASTLYVYERAADDAGRFNGVRRVAP